MPIIFELLRIHQETEDTTFTLEELNTTGGLRGDNKMKYI